jgi:DNA-binding transcriptional LysR family regulator
MAMSRQIKRSRLPLTALRAFEAAARHRNLVRAADELSVTHGAISHQICSLETELKAPLFYRRRRPILLTQAGEQLLAAVHDSFERLTRVASAIQNGEIEGEITPSCVPGLAANWLVPRLGQFLSLHANVAVHVVTDYWRHPKIADQSDLAIAYGSAEHPVRRVVLLAHAEFFPVCNPALRQRKPPLRRPPDIAAHTLLHEYTDEAWSRWLAAAGLAGLNRRAMCISTERICRWKRHAPATASRWATWQRFAMISRSDGWSGCSSRQCRPPFPIISWHRRKQNSRPLRGRWRNGSPPSSPRSSD